jgi:hypothetical protein
LAVLQTIFVYVIASAFFFGNCSPTDSFIVIGIDTMPSDKYSIDYLLRKRTPSPRFDTTNTDCYLIDEHLQMCQHLDDDVMVSSSIITSPPIPSSSDHHHRRVYNCQRCLNHNRRQIRKNHKTKCLYQHCNCDKCQMVDKRRELNHKLVEIDGIKLLHSITKELNCTSTIRGKNC